MSKNENVRMICELQFTEMLHNGILLIHILYDIIVLTANDRVI